MSFNLQFVFFVFFLKPEWHLCAKTRNTSTHSDISDCVFALHSAAACLHVRVCVSLVIINPLAFCFIWLWEFTFLPVRIFTRFQAQCGANFLRKSLNFSTHLLLSIHQLYEPLLRVKPTDVHVYTYPRNKVLPATIGGNSCKYTHF